jgi:transposase
MAYSMDFRRAAARAYDECGSSAEVAEQLGCGASWVRRLIRNREARGTLEPLPAARRDAQRAYDDADEQTVRELVRRRPDATLAEAAGAPGKTVHQGTVGRTLAKPGLPREKSPRTPPSRAAQT